MPAVIASALRYLTFRLRYDPRELVIRSGLLFRNERHVPFAKIQNLDAVQNAFHRLLGVVEIRVQTGGGKDDEARLSVLPIAAFEEMRQRVFEGRAGGPAPSTSDDTVHPQAGAAPVTLLHLAPSRVAAVRVSREQGNDPDRRGLRDRLGIGAPRWLLESPVRRGDVRSRIVARPDHELFEGKELPITAVGVALGGLVALLLLIRVISMAWAFLRLVRLPSLADP